MALNTRTSNRLLEGHTTGAYQLPTPLLEAFAAYEALSAVLNEVPAAPEPREILEQLALATQQAAATGKTLPKTDALTKAHAAVQAREHHVDVLRRALEVASDRIVSEASPDLVFEGSLQPALADVIALIREEVMPAIPDELASDRAMVTEADDTAFAAWRRLTQLSVRYDSIRNAQRLYGLTAYDGEEYAEIENIDEIWPGWRYRASAMGHVSAPWPDEPRARLLWLVRHGAHLICWTPQERDERAQEEHQRRVDDQLRRTGRATAQVF